jgi:hypothetical protein
MSNDYEICNRLHYQNKGIPEGHLKFVKSITGGDTPGTGGFTGIDWELLRAQKLEVIRLANGGKPTPETPHLLDGVLGLMDWLQDLAAAAGVYKYPANRERK